MIRTEYGLTVERFCEVVGLPRSSFYRWRRRAGEASAHRPTPVQDAIETQIVEVAKLYPMWGHRKGVGLTRADGMSASTRSVARVMARRGLLLPARYQAERRQLARERREAFLEPPTGRNQVRQLDFSEFETTGGGVWQFAPVVAYHAKPCLASRASTTKTAHDAIAAVGAAIAEAERLRERRLLEELTDPDTGEITPATIVTDNGSCFRAGAFAAFIDKRPELRHVRTRHTAPETNGVVERYIESVTYEHLYRHEIPDGPALALHLDAYRDIYNRIRPHEAIGFDTPQPIPHRNPNTYHRGH